MEPTKEKIMRVIVFVKATKDSETGILPDISLFEAMGKYNDELIKAGIMRDGAGLQPSSKAKRVAMDGPKRTVIDGPFSTSSPGDLVCGFWLWEVKDMNEAMEWAKKCPNTMPGPSEIEIRPFIDESEFAQILEASKQQKRKA